MLPGTVLNEQRSSYTLKNQGFKKEFFAGMPIFGFQNNLSENSS